MPARSEDTLGLYLEHGLTDRLTVQAKLAWTRGEDPFAAWNGRGPVELGLRYTVLSTDRSAVSLYLGGVLAGEGRNAGYASPGAGDGDLEARLLAGRSFRLRGRPAFAEVQLARLDRSGLADETRLDLTLGLEPSTHWLILAQTYSGQADGATGARWTKLELSGVRRLGDWRLQAGWRTAMTGRDSPADAGPVLAIWRRF